MKIITNNVPRDLIEGWELPEKDRKEFEWANWPAIDEGKDSATFFRYKGQLYALDNFERIPYSDLQGRGWDGYCADTYFSGILIRIAGDNERVVVGRYYS